MFDKNFQAYEIVSSWGNGSAIFGKLTLTNKETITYCTKMK